MFFSDFCIFSLFNLKLITSVHDDEYHPLQNRQLFAESGKKPHIYSSYQFCLVKVLLIAVAFEDGVCRYDTLPGSMKFGFHHHFEEQFKKQENDKIDLLYQ